MGHGEPGDALELSRLRPAEPSGPHCSASRAPNTAALGLRLPTYRLRGTHSNHRTLHLWSFSFSHTLLLISNFSVVRDSLRCLLLELQACPLSWSGKPGLCVVSSVSHASLRRVSPDLSLLRSSSKSSDFRALLSFPHEPFLVGPSFIQETAFFFHILTATTLIVKFFVLFLE